METDAIQPVAHFSLKPGQSVRAGHPWLTLTQLDVSAESTYTVCSASLTDADGNALGSGIFDPLDPVAAWRRFSWETAASFDAEYIADAIQAALERRSDEACQRLIASDADYLPGLVVEIFGEVLTVRAETRAMEAHLDTVLEIFTELVGPREIVLDNDCARRAAVGLDCSLRTQSGQNLKGFWIEVDGLLYRLDLLNTSKPRFALVQREQHALVGSLCAERRVLSLFAREGGFALQAARSEASSVVAVDTNADFVKAIGANAQRNELNVDTVHADALDYLQAAQSGSFDAIILDSPESLSAESMQALHLEAYRVLAQGGVLATYSRSASTTTATFEDLLNHSAAVQGREGRIFAQTAQPFDFPRLLSLPESTLLKGFILQVE